MWISAPQAYAAALHHCRQLSVTKYTENLYKTAAQNEQKTWQI